MAILAYSCDITGSTEYDRESLMKNESVLLVESNLLFPAAILDNLILLDNYLQASGEERDSSIVYAWLRKNLLVGDDNMYSLGDEIKLVSTGGRSLSEPGAKWKVECFSIQSGEKKEFLVDSPGKSGLWSVTDEYGIVTILEGTEGSKEYVVSLSGDRPTGDGYVCSVRTEGEFTLDCYNTEWVPKGTLVHTISRGAKTYESCRAVYSGRRFPSSVTITKL